MSSTTYNRREIFIRAWGLAYRMATANGGAARTHFAEALRIIWHNVKMAAIDAARPRPSRKQIARDLDSAAARADMIGQRPATSRQCWYLAGLLLNAGDDADADAIKMSNDNAILTSKTAAAWISRYA